MKHPRHQPRHRPGPRHLRWLYALGSLLLLSGVGWLIAHYALRPAAGAFGELPHPSEPWWLRLHGAAALGFLVAFGALLPHHVGHNWRRRQHYRTGLTLVIAVGVLTLSGYGLYYLVSDTLRPMVSIVHWIVGLFCTAMLLTHVVLSYRRAAEDRRVRARRHVSARELASNN
jgi:cation transport ATPase